MLSRRSIGDQDWARYGGEMRARITGPPSYMVPTARMPTRAEANIAMAAAILAASKPKKRRRRKTTRARRSYMY